MEVLEQISQEKDFLVLIDLASNSKTPADVLDRLSLHDCDEIRAAVGRNHSFKDLEKLADDLSPRVRAGVAQNLRANRDLMAKLANDNEETVREGVALNPMHIMSQFQHDPSKLVRLRFAQNKNTPGVILAHLSDDMSALVRKAVYLHINTPPETKKKLLNEFQPSRAKDSEHS